MTEEQLLKNFDKLGHNRKVDVLIALCIFHWDDITIFVHGDYSICTGIQNKKLPYEVIPCYSTLLTSAWDIIRKFDYCYLYRSKDFKGGQWECKLRDDRGPLIIGEEGEGGKYYAWADTEMLAICYAGLKAVGFDVKGFLKEEKDK
jgi:hypothetical protein